MLKSVWYGAHTSSKKQCTRCRVCCRVWCRMVPIVDWWCCGVCSVYFVGWYRWSDVRCVAPCVTVCVTVCVAGCVAGCVEG